MKCIIAQLNILKCWELMYYQVYGNVLTLIECQRNRINKSTIGINNKRQINHNYLIYKITLSFIFSSRWTHSRETVSCKLTLIIIIIIFNRSGSNIVIWRSVVEKDPWRPTTRIVSTKKQNHLMHTHHTATIINGHQLR